jgi:hypothetical protein
VRGQPSHCRSAHHHHRSPRIGFLRWRLGCRRLKGRWLRWLGYGGRWRRWRVRRCHLERCRRFRRYRYPVAATACAPYFPADRHP